MGIDRGEIPIMDVGVQRFDGKGVVRVIEALGNTEKVLCRRALRYQVCDHFLDFSSQSFLDRPCGFRWNKGKFGTGFFHKILIDGHLQKYAKQNGNRMLVFGKLK